MASDRWNELKGILEEALGLPPGERSDFLGRACPDDLLRRDIESLIAHGDGFLSASPEVGSDGVELPDQWVEGIVGEGGIDAPSFEGRRVGPFLLLEQIGQGGMGVVYRAEQEEPVRREVALKLIKWGLGSETLIARFESERQALAMMSHESIARVYDAGSTDEGQPYFAMEFVPGVPITIYCDRERLSLRERLALFVQVCEGVQHAHQKGIIHRDIKPSNVLIATAGTRPVPKIIDFGIAKATATTPRLTEKSVTTQMGQFVGTPEYMSPEQASMANLDVDTRTDVYSLGVLLYELLVGTQPFDSEELRSSGFDEIRRKIREQDPPTPSRRLTDLGSARRDTATKRGLTQPPTLERQLRGDLDWITMKALEKDRARRYGSPAELAADLERHLNHEPVLAGPPSRLYRAGKFVRRHRFGVSAAAVLLAALIVGIAGTGLGLLRAARAERVASREAAKAEAVNDFMRETLGSANPFDAGHEVTVAEALFDAVARIEELSPQPAVEGAIRDTIGASFLGLGRLEEAEQQLTAGLAAQKLAYGNADHGDVAESLHHLGRLRQQQGKYSEAEAEFRRSIEMRRRLFGDEHPDVADSRSALGVMLVEVDRLDEAEALVREALASRRRAFGDHHRAVAQSLGDLGDVLREAGKGEEAEVCLRESLAMYRELLGEDHPELAYGLNSLGLLLLDRGELDDAEQKLRESVAITRRISSEKNPVFAVTLMNLGLILRRKGELDQAEAFYWESLGVMRELYGDTHPDIAVLLCNLGSLQESKASYQLALESYRAGLTMLPEVVGPDHWFVYNCQRLHGRCLTKMKRFSAAEGELLAAYRGLSESLGPAHSRTVDTLKLLRELYQSWGKTGEARTFGALLEKAQSTGPS